MKPILAGALIALLACGGAGADVPKPGPADSQESATVDAPKATDASPPAPGQPAAASPAVPQPAEDVIAAPALAPGADYRKGVLFGRVVDAASGKPVAGATVAIQDPNGKVVAWTKTNADGRYALAGDCLKLLRLEPSRHRGLLMRIVQGVGGVVAVPVKVAESAVGVAAGAARATVTQGVQGVASAAASTAVTGSPLPAVSQIASNVVQSERSQAAATVQDRATQAVLGRRHAPSKDAKKKVGPGEVMLAVTAPNYHEAAGVAGAFWMEPAATIGGADVGPGACLGTVHLGLASGDKKSEIEHAAVKLSGGTLDPAMAAAGSPVHVSVKLDAPEGVASRVRVYAREAHKRQVVELRPDGSGGYQGELLLDPHSPKGPTTVTLVALRSEPVEVKLPKDKNDPLAKFVAADDALEPGKPYDFDPRIMASENRIDLPLTVLDPKQATPPARAGG